MTKAKKGKESYLVGVISDTHGKFPRGTEEFFSGADLIIHAGDIGGLDILEALEAISPVVAVRGNTDHDAWASELNWLETVRMGDLLIYVIHDLQVLHIEEMPTPSVVIHGHTHRPSTERKDNVLFVNPGSAIHPRHNTYPSIALLHIDGKTVDVQFIKLS